MGRELKTFLTVSTFNGVVEYGELNVEKMLKILELINYLYF